jgi:hypothetical protein
MPDIRAHDEVYCPDCGRQWVASSEGVHWAGCQHLNLAKRPSQLDDDELLRLALWLADGGVRRQAPSELDWSAQDDRTVRGVPGRLIDDCQKQVPPGGPGSSSVGAAVGPSSSRPEPEPTRPEPEPPPQPTKPPEPEPPKPEEPEAISEQTLGMVERLGYRLGRGIAVVLLVAVVAVSVAVVWWLIALS